jgi:predicted flavoprotein YhiN
VSRAVREGAELVLDLAPDRSVGALAERLSGSRGKESVGNWLRKRLGLDPVKLALLMEFGRPLPEEAALADLVKRLPVRHQEMRPMDEAISTAGGVRWDAVDEWLMLRAVPGVFVAGEMLDWEAPTGGYLLTACLATGRWAGRAAAGW